MSKRHDPMFKPWSDHIVIIFFSSLPTDLFPQYWSQSPLLFQSFMVTYFLVFIQQKKRKWSIFSQKLTQHALNYFILFYLVMIGPTWVICLTLKTITVAQRRWYVNWFNLIRNHCWVLGSDSQSTQEKLRLLSEKGKE